MIFDLNTTVLKTDALFEIVVRDTALKNFCWLGLSCNNILWIIFNKLVVIEFLLTVWYFVCFILCSYSQTIRYEVSGTTKELRKFTGLSIWKYNLYFKLDIVCFQRTVQLFNAYQP